MFHGVLDEVDNGVALELGKTTKTKVSWEKIILKTFPLLQFSAQDPFKFDADPDPGSALKKMDPDPGHFFKIY